MEIPIGTEAADAVFAIEEINGHAEITFAAKDVVKLLAYSDDFYMVLGTRTTKEMIWGGANMGWFLRLGNYCVAKCLEILYNTPSLSDVGCTMRLIRRNALQRIEPHFTVGGSHFNPEMVILASLNDVRFVEIPVNYRERVGRSSVTGNKLMVLRVGLQMLCLIAAYRVTSLFDRRM